MNYETLFVNPMGRTARGRYVGAMIPLLAAVAFYYFLVKGVNGQWCLTVLLIPAMVLNARRLNDMGKTGLLVLIPAALLALASWLTLFNPGASYKTGVYVAAVVLAAAFAAWGLLGKSRT